MLSEYEMIRVDIVGEEKNVGLITLHRPKSYNALCEQLLDELISALKSLDKDSSIGAVIITGSQKVFAAGADILELHGKTFPEMYTGQIMANASEIGKIGKPIIAAVNGLCFGGGCELAMMCDIVYAGETAQFAQPEINLGIVPGAGGTQRWPRSVGKSLAMEMCLTGNKITAQEAKDAGLVSKVFPTENLLQEAIKLAEKIAKQPPLIVRMCKEAVNVSFETTLQEGLRFEKRLFHSSFATPEPMEGMSAFVEKRKPQWSKL